MMGSRISIIIPVYNEEKSIKRVVEGIHSSMKLTNYDYEIVVVDDGSTDATSNIVSTLEVKLVSHLENKGVGKARKTGILHSTGDIIVMIDGDGSYPTEEIPTLLKYFPKYDIVIGARKREAGSFWLLRRVTKFIFKKIAEYIVQKKIPDLNSGMMAFKRPHIQKFLPLLPDGHSWVATTTLAFLAEKLDVKFIPIEYYKREGRSSFHPVKDSFSYLLLVFRTIMYFKPLRIFLPLSFFLILVGIIRSVYDALVLHNLKDSDVIIILTGVLTINLGLLADLIVKKR